MPANHTDLEKRLWDAADELRANSKLKSSEYSVPVLGLVFLRYADHKFTEAEKKMPQSSGRRKIGKADYQAQGVLYLPEKSRFGYLLNLPEGTDIGALHAAAAERGVAFVKGSDFVLEGYESSLRLAYSGVTPAEIEEGVSPATSHSG